MAVSTGKKIVLIAILAVGYFIGNGVNEHQKYDELKARNAEELTVDEKEFIRKVESERSKAELDRKQYQLEQKKKEEADKPRRDLIELQIAVRMACEDTAKSILAHPSSYENEQHEDGVDKQGDIDVYYFTLHYSGVNAFNVRSTHTIECYGTVGDEKHKVTYRTFN